MPKPTQTKKATRLDPDACECVTEHGAKECLGKKDMYNPHVKDSACTCIDEHYCGMKTPPAQALFKTLDGAKGYMGSDEVLRRVNAYAANQATIRELVNLAFNSKLWMETVAHEKGEDVNKYANYKRLLEILHRATEGSK